MTSLLYDYTNGKAEDCATFQLIALNDSMDNHFFLHVFYLAMNTFTYSKIKKKTLLTITMCRKGKMLIYLTHQIEQA